MKVEKLGYDIALIDLYDVGLDQRTGSYVFLEEDITIIETSASPSIPYLLNGLKELGVDPKTVKNIIVTHIHLDHAGGVGLLLEHCPQAKVFVHPKGKRHLADPSRLIESAKTVYGEQKFNQLFDPILPVPEERLIVKEHLDTLKIGENRILTFYHTPGHANHHFSIFDPLSNGMFTGDTIGVFYTKLLDSGLEFYLPSTSPNQFDPNKMLDSLKQIEELNISRIFFGHYGMSEHPEVVFNHVKYWLDLFVDNGRQIILQNESKPFEEKSKQLYDLLYKTVCDYLSEKGISAEHAVHKYLKLDLMICSQGIIDYLQKSSSLK